MRLLKYVFAIVLFPVFLWADSTVVTMTVVDISGDSIGYYKMQVEMDGILTAIDTASNLLVVNNSRTRTASSVGVFTDTLVQNENMIYNSRGDHPWYRFTITHSTMRGGSAMLKGFIDADSTDFDLGTKTEAIQFTQ